MNSSSSRRRAGGQDRSAHPSTHAPVRVGVMCAVCATAAWQQWLLITAVDKEKEHTPLSSFSTVGRSNFLHTPHLGFKQSFSLNWDESMSQQYSVIQLKLVSRFPHLSLVKLLRLEITIELNAFYCLNSLHWNTAKFSFPVFPCFFSCKHTSCSSTNGYVALDFWKKWPLFPT